MLKELHTQGETAEAVDSFLENFDHHTEFFRTHYYNILERIAIRKPVLHSTAHNNGFSVVTSHDMISKVSNRNDVFSNISGYRVVPLSTVPPMIPDDLDGDEHVYFRRVLNPYFSPKVIEGYTQQVKSDIRRIILEGREKGMLDIATELGQPVTGMLTMRLLGFPVEDWEAYSLPIHNAAFNIGSLETRIAEGAVFGQRVKDELGRLAHEPDAAGLIGHLVRSRLDGRQITLDEIERILINLIIGGLDTTQAVLSSMAVYLGRHVDRQRELAQHPERIPGAVLEFLRIFGSAPMTGRYNMTDVEVDGYHFPAGETTLLFWPAGNFDPAFVEQPFNVNFTRERFKNVTFAMGPHRCLGLNIAKMELTAFLEQLIELAPGYTLQEEGIVLANDISSTVAYLNVPVKFAN